MTKKLTYLISLSGLIAGLAASPLYADLRDEARTELREDLGVESRQNAFTEGDKANDFQLGKSLIDIHGNRVRLEEGIIHQGNVVTFYALNFREGVADHLKKTIGTMKATFNSDIANIGEVGSVINNSFGSRTKPDNWLTSMNMYATNTIDHVYSDLTLGDPTEITFTGWGAFHYPLTIDYTLRLQGPGYNNIKTVIDIDYNPGTNVFTFIEQYPQTLGGAPTTVQDFSWNSETFAYTDNCGGPCPGTAPDHTLSHPSGPDKSDWKGTATYADGSFLSLRMAYINNGGKVLSRNRLGLPDIDPGEGIKGEGDVNIEIILEASEFDGRSIDLVIDPSILEKASEGDDDPRKEGSTL